jgi:hypothetical protein
MNRVKTFDATGIAPGGRLYAGDLNAIQDAAAALTDYAQSIGVANLKIGDASIILSKFGTGEASLAGAFRVSGLLRGLGGIIAGAFTTAARDAIALNAGLGPYGTIILNTTTNRYEWNSGTDAARTWLPIGGAGPWNTADIVDGAITSAKILDGTIANIDVAAAAAIAYSKLALTNSVVNADIAAAAAIAYSKLALTGAIVNADIAAAAAIASSKLAAFASVTGTLGADVTIVSANTFYDGPSVSCVAGTWLLIAQISMLSGLGAQFTAKLWDGSTVTSSSEFDAGSTLQSPIPIVGIVTPGGTTTYKVSVASQRGASDGAIKAAAATNGAGNNATKLVGLRIA